MASACNVQFTDVEFEAALSNSLQHFHHISGLKHEQKLCLETVAQKRDVFGILPTGFGKSLIFQLLPCLLKDLWKLQRACVLVVTPLVSIMKDQVEELTRLGLRAFAIGLGDEKGEKELVAGGFEPKFRTYCVGTRRNEERLLLQRQTDRSRRALHVKRYPPESYAS